MLFRSGLDLQREAHMRGILAELDARRSVAVVGAFHAPALLEGEAMRITAAGDVVTSLVAYADPLLDSRSGYPAGIRGPPWQAGGPAAHAWRNGDVQPDDPSDASASPSSLGASIPLAVGEGDSYGPAHLSWSCRLMRALSAR